MTEIEIIPLRLCEECELPLNENIEDSVHPDCAAAFCEDCGIFLHDIRKNCGILCDQCEQMRYENDIEDEEDHDY